ncbi:MAG: hypothetical protein M3356_03985, partial [Actinomycetota bacterium]|nr:hypothetical protein [Actinomycetota bacterium]
RPELGSRHAASSFCAPAMTGRWFAVTRARRRARLHGPTWILRSTLAGKVLATARRNVGLVGRWRASRRRARAEATPSYSQAGERRTYRAVFLVLAGPGEGERVADLIASIHHYEGADVKILIVDDATEDCRAGVLQAQFPDVDVLRTSWPIGGIHRQFPQMARALRELPERYDFRVLAKVDSDALVTGPGLTQAAEAVFASHPRTGLLGTTVSYPDGTPRRGMFAFEAWMIAHSRRWSRRVRRLFDAAADAREGPYVRVQGGVYLVSRAALETAAQRGLLRWRQPWWSRMGEDVIMSAVVEAAGFAQGSWGGPGEPIASAQNVLPLALADIVAQRRLAVHSVRRGLHGESEEHVRAFFAARRTTPTSPGMRTMH